MSPCLGLRTVLLGAMRYYVVYPVSHPPSAAYMLHTNLSPPSLPATQQLARLHPRLVCQEALPCILQVLQDRASSEEYTECLYVLDSLVKCKDPAATAANAEQILEDSSNAELLLDLLEHADPTIGVMASQVLTELHAADAARLEDLIQLCPDGACVRHACQVMSTGRAACALY